MTFVLLDAVKFTDPFLSLRRWTPVSCSQSCLESLAIVRRSVLSSPVMEELRRQGQQRCKGQRRAHLGNARPDSDSEDSVKRLSRVLGTCNVFPVVEMFMVLITDMVLIILTQITAVRTSFRPLLGIMAVPSSLFSRVWHGIH